MEFGRCLLTIWREHTASIFRVKGSAKNKPSKRQVARRASDKYYNVS
jgi:hypothetical protein